MKFSIITCTYNSEKYLHKNIDSLVSQTCTDFEHVFIDGFSCDGTMEIIEQYRKKYPDRVRVYQAKPQGISHAMNEGIKKSTGEYLIHLHSDDSLYDERVLETVNTFIIQNNNPDWLYGKAHIINALNGSERIIPQLKICYTARFWQMLIMNNYIPHQSVFIKKDIFDQYGTFSEVLKNFMDYDLWLHLLKSGVQPLFINTIICNFSVRENTQSSIGRSDGENIVLYKKYVSHKTIIVLLAFVDWMRRKIMHKMPAYNISQKKS